MTSNYYSRYCYLKSLAKQKGVINKYQIITSDLNELKRIISSIKSSTKCNMYNGYGNDDDDMNLRIKTSGIKTSGKRKKEDLSKEKRRRDQKKAFEKRKMERQKAKFENLTYLYDHFWDETWDYIRSQMFNEALKSIKKVIEMYWSNPINPFPGKWESILLKTLIEYWIKDEEPWAFARDSQIIKMKSTLEKEGLKYYHFYYLVGLFYSKLTDDYEHVAIEYLETSLQIDNTITNLESFKLIIELNMILSDFSEARTYLLKLNEIQPNNFRILADLSIVHHYYYQNITQALVRDVEMYAQKSLKSKKNSSAYYVLGRMYYLRRDYHTAVEMYTKSIEYEKIDNRIDLSTVYYHRAKSLSKLKNEKSQIQVIKDLERATEFNKGNLKRRIYPGYFMFRNHPFGQEHVMDVYINLLRERSISLLKSVKFKRDVTKW